MANRLEPALEQDLRRTAAVAADYNTLQGLITIGTGLGLVAMALDQAAWGAIIIALGVAVGTAWYQRHFGLARGRQHLGTSVLLVLLALLVIMTAYTVDRIFSWPVLLFPLAAAGFLAGSFLVSYRHVGVTGWHWLVTGLLALAALLPLTGSSQAAADRGGQLALAGALVVIGLVDHLRLVRAMKPIPHD